MKYCLSPEFLSSIIFKQYCLGGAVINISLKIALAIVGTIIGAGFATGKELMVFFGETTVFQTILLVFSIFLMCITALTYFKIIIKLKDNKILNWIFYLFSAGCTSIMLACGGQTIYENTNLDLRIGILITYLVVIFTIKFGIEGVYKFNVFATPIIIFSLLLISFVGQINSAFLESTAPLVNSFSYAGYNILSVLPLLKAVSVDTDFDDGFYGIIIAFLIIFIVSLALKLLLNSYFDIIMYDTIPILKIISLSGKYYSYIYSIVLYISILTTAVTCLFVVTKGKNILLISLPLLAISFLGFSTLLEKLYTNFGYIGIIIIIYLLMKGIIYAKRK